MHQQPQSLEELSDERRSIDIDAGTITNPGHNDRVLWRVEWPTEGISDYFPTEQEARAFRDRFPADLPANIQLRELTTSWNAGSWVGVDRPVMCRRGNGKAHVVSPDPARFACGRAMDGMNWKRVDERNPSQVCRKCNEHPQPSSPGVGATPIGDPRQGL